jgi:hypothetical protein
MPEEVRQDTLGMQLPVHFRYSPFLRGFMISVSSFVSVYTLYFLIRYVDAATPLFFKLLPLFIMFVAMDNCFKHLTTLNKVSFYADSVHYSYLLKRKVVIPYTSVLHMELRRHIGYMLQLRYSDLNGKEQLFSSPASFPKTLEIMLILADLCPNIKLSDKLGKAFEQMRNTPEVIDAK